MQTLQQRDNRVTSSQVSQCRLGGARGELCVSMFCGVSMFQTVIRGIGGCPLLPDMLRPCTNHQTEHNSKAAPPPHETAQDTRGPVAPSTRQARLRGCSAWEPPKEDLRGHASVGKGVGAQGQERGAEPVCV